MRMPPMKKVDSSVVKEIGWDDNEDLYVKFIHNEEKVLYCYHGVKYDDFMKFMSSESKGQFFNTHVKHAYEWTKIEKHPKKAAKQAAKDEKEWRQNLTRQQKAQLAAAEETVKYYNESIIDLTHEVQKMQKTLDTLTEKHEAALVNLETIRNNLRNPCLSIPVDYTRSDKPIEDAPGN